MGEIEPDLVADESPPPHRRRVKRRIAHHAHFGRKRQQVAIFLAVAIAAGVGVAWFVESNLDGAPVDTGPP